MGEGGVQEEGVDVGFLFLFILVLEGEVGEGGEHGGGDLCGDGGGRVVGGGGVEGGEFCLNLVFYGGLENVCVCEWCWERVVVSG